MSALSRLLALLAALLLVACTSLAQRDEATPDAEAAEPESAPPAETLPEQELTEPVLYEMLLGEIALQRGDAALAAQTFAELAQRTRDPRVARRAVEIANIARTPQFALQAALVWHEADPASVQALQTVAALLVRERRVEEAEPYLAKLLARDGDAAANGFMQLGRLLAGNPDKQTNLRMVRTLAERHPDLPQARLAVAQAALAANDETTALAETRRAAAMRPGWEPAAIYEAQILQRRSSAEAARSLNAFLEQHPQSREARLAYARLLVADRRYAEARVEFEKLLAAHPGDADVLYAVSLLAMQLKDYATAEASLRKLLDAGYRDPDSLRFMLGQAAEEQKKWDQAVRWYESIERGDQALAARLRVAGVLGKQGKLDEARAYLRTLEADGAERVQVLIAEAQLLRDADRHREAYELLGKALKAQPEQPELLYDYALTAEKLERYDVLESSLRRLIKLKPDYAHAYNALGYSLADRNQRLPEARKLIERALELSPEDYYIIDSMGWVLYRMGDLKGAEQYLRRAYDGRPDAEISAHLGEVLWAMGERVEAERVWQEALKSHPENELLHKTMKRLRR
ncbi:MAG: tetratricopeptide repeat protein [Betaproteobacteria bacterium]|nr:tetratricopeptide repeat protein [Betaproteobacteria bacterium]MDH5221797.1 tetratricopeptide repeat protein [Betaproteobacteria bacterium]MDH5349223.1 tetratricopeptide repeat protein [Betaproteobacteria bacterium]